MIAYSRLVDRFNGQRPQIDCWSPTEYRVVYHSHHLHNGAVSGAPSGGGKTLEAACDALLRQIDQPHVELVEGSCDWRCENRYDDSPKAKLAHRHLMDYIKETAARVDRWPAWKRGLPPCANCEMAAGHPGECE